MYLCQAYEHYHPLNGSSNFTLTEIILKLIDHQVSHTLKIYLPFMSINTGLSFISKDSFNCKAKKKKE